MHGKTHPIADLPSKEHTGNSIRHAEGLAVGWRSAPNERGQLPADLSIYESFYRTVHQNRETSNTESHTAFLIPDYLRSLGLEVHMGTGGDGIAGVFTNGDGDGKAILMRAERGGKLLVV